jgi:hypothetical protein
VADIERKTATPPPLKDVDEEITALFQQWLVAFEKTQSATDDEESAAALASIESRIEATPAEGLRGLAVKLGLQRFMHEHTRCGEQFSRLCLFRSNASDRL